jgi:hypothetical protein
VGSNAEHKVDERLQLWWVLLAVDFQHQQNSFFQKVEKLIEVRKVHETD